jgi:hypothetical protein
MLIKYDRMFPANEPHFTTGKPCVFKHKNELLIADTETNEADSVALLANEYEARDSPPNPSMSSAQLKEGKAKQRRSSSLHTEIGEFLVSDLDQKQMKYLRKNLINERFGTTITESIYELESNPNDPSFRIKYNPNDLVMTYTNIPNRNKNETPNWHGPFRIIKQEEQFYYQIEPEKGGIKTKAHVQRLRLYKGKAFKNKNNEDPKACGLS